VEGVVIDFLIVDALVDVDFTPIGPVGDIGGPERWPGGADRSGNELELCNDENVAEGLDRLKTDTISRSRAVLGQIIGTEPGGAVIVGQPIFRCCGRAHVFDITICGICRRKEVEVTEKAGRASPEIFDQFVL